MAKIAHTLLLAAVDVGSSKICAMIALDRPGQALEVIGIGHTTAGGIRSGVVVDLEAAQYAIGRAVQEAEDATGERLTSVLINISGGGIESQRLVVHRNIEDEEITSADMSALLATAVPETAAAERLLLHKIAVQYTLNDTIVVDDPKGMAAQRLSADAHLVHTDRTVATTLVRAVRGCHLEVASVVASPYASALSCLVEDERQLGATVIDMGAGTTTVAVFQGGVLIYLASIPVGGHHITMDIARGLSTSVVDAERIKVSHGSALANTLDDRDILEIPIVGETDKTHTSHVPRSYLTRIIQPRIEETFEMVRALLEEAGLDRATGRLVVLTGGGAQLPGVRDAAAQILEKKVRLGRPYGLAGLPAECQGAAFATVTGLLRYAQMPPVDAMRLPTASRRRREGTSVGGSVSMGGSRLAKAVGWLRENF
ncbi:MAG: cell division protein FtsA [Holosporales bacterium]